MNTPITRRTFVTRATGAAAAVMAGARITGLAQTAGQDDPVTADKLLEFFFSKASWIKRETTVDRVIAGDAKKPLHKVLVAWMPSLAVVEYAIKGGYDLLLTHEPTYYDHRDYLTNPDELKKVPIAVQKKKLIDESGLVIIRNHDVWDVFPEIGIPFAWARFLGFEGPPAQIGGGNYMHRYDIAPVSFDEFAKRIAGRCAKGGEPALQICGRGDQVISKVGIGTGCATNLPIFQFMGCDVAIVCDDGTIYWKQLQQAADEGYPFIRIHHGTSEVPGMESLAQYVRKNFPALQVDYLPQTPIFRTVTAAGVVG